MSEFRPVPKPEKTPKKTKTTLKRKALSKKPKATLTKLKSQLWDIFTLYIKIKHSHDGLNGSCYTCDAQIQIGTVNNQGGHWLPKKGYPFHYFTEDNVRPQCFRCNHNLEGNSAVFERRLIREIGAAAVEEIYNTRHNDAKRDRNWYHEKIKEYTEKLNAIRK